MEVGVLGCGAEELSDPIGMFYVLMLVVVTGMSKFSKIIEIYLFSGYIYTLLYTYIVYIYTIYTLYCTKLQHNRMYLCKNGGLNKPSSSTTGCGTFVIYSLLQLNSGWILTLRNCLPKTEKLSMSSSPRKRTKCSKDRSDQSALWATKNKYVQRGFRLMGGWSLVMAKEEDREF